MHIYINYVRTQQLRFTINYCSCSNIKSTIEYYSYLLLFKLFLVEIWDFVFVCILMFLHS